jgi:hypothetical protein
LQRIVVEVDELMGAEVGRLLKVRHCLQTSVTENACGFG